MLRCRIQYCFLSKTCSHYAYVTWDREWKVDGDKARLCVLKYLFIILWQALRFIWLMYATRAYYSEPALCLTLLLC